MLKRFGSDIAFMALALLAVSIVLGADGNHAAEIAPHMIAAR